MMSYFMHYGPKTVTFEISGALAGNGARALAQEWRTASSVIGNRLLIVDFTLVTEIDSAGRELMRRWYLKGARFVSASPTGRLLVQTITGTPVPGSLDRMA